MIRFTLKRGMLAWLLAALVLPAWAQEGTLMLSDPSVHGNTIVFAYGGDLYRVGTDGGTAIRLTTDEGVESNVRISPDGQRVAFSAQYEGNTDVYIMPIGGGVPTRLTYHPGGDIVQGWSQDGQRVLFSSGRDAYSFQFTQLYTVPVTGGLPSLLPLPMAHRGAFSPDGKQLAYLQINEPFVTWKRYRGGRVDPIRVIDLQTLDSYMIGDEDKTNNTFPVWLGQQIFFLSDRAGLMNVWVYNTQSKALKQVTQFNDYDVKYLSGNGSSLVFEQGGRVHHLDASSLQHKPISINVISDLAQRRPKWVNAMGTAQLFGGGFFGLELAGADVSPSAKRVVVQARGEVITVPLENGDARNLTASSNRFEHSPAWSPTGGHLAYFASGTKGEDHRLAVIDQSGKEAPRYYDMERGTSDFYKPTWSPDGKYIAFTAKATFDIKLQVLEVETGKITTIDQGLGEYVNFMNGVDISWSHDSKWLSWARANDNYLANVYLYSMDSGQRTQVTNDLGLALSPSFSPDGKYLYFLGSTNNVGYTSWFEMSNFLETVTYNIYAVVLQAGGVSPFLPKSDEEPVKDDSEQPKEEASDEDEGYTIDLDGIAGRIVGIQGMPQLSYSRLTATDGGFFVVTPNTMGPGNILHKYSLEKQSFDAFATGMLAYKLSGNGKHVLVGWPGNQLTVSSAAGKANPATDRVSGLNNVQIYVDPGQEWEQMYYEVLRIQEAFFYDPELHGADWNAVRAKYAKMLPHVASRQELTAIFSDVIGELVVGHAFTGGGDVQGAGNTNTGLLGADYSLENGRYRIAKIYTGEDWNGQLKGPLAHPGVDVNEGDYIMAINGTELSGSMNIHSLLVGQAGKQVLLKVASNPNGTDAHEETVVPTGFEGILRQQAWIQSRIDYVSEKSGGRIGYAFVPNTGGGGFTSFRRHYFAQLDKDAMVVDVRYNSGGSVADYVVHITAMEPWNYFMPRNGRAYTNPQMAIDGPKVMLCNEFSSSGGDYLPWAFRDRGVGQLVGVRTWGGLVGIPKRYPLIDGGWVTSPSIGFLTLDGKWDIEYLGVAPDHELWQDPKLVAQGQDPQLDKAIELMLEELKTYQTAPEPKRPGTPNYAKY